MRYSLFFLLSCVIGYAQITVPSFYGSYTSKMTAVVLVPQSGGTAICDGSKATVVIPLTSTTGKVWMDRNLGASRAASSATDYLAYGCLYQWGRGNDGHASINWTSATVGNPVNGATATLATSDTPGNALFISNSTDWRSDNNNTRWQGINGVNNPCPSGYHVPTNVELDAEFSAYAISNAATAYANGPSGGFKFVLAGLRYFNNSRIENQGSYGFLWSSTVNGSGGKYRNLFNGVYYNNRPNGFSVRCIKD